MYYHRKGTMSTCRLTFFALRVAEPESGLGCSGCLIPLYGGKSLALQTRVNQQQVVDRTGGGLPRVVL